MTLNTGTVLYNHHFSLHSKLSHHRKHPSSSLPSFHLLSVSMNLPVLSNSYKWNHILFLLLCLAYFTKHVFKVHSFCSIHQNLIPFYGWIIFYCMCIPHFVHFICWWTLGCFHILAIVDNAAVNIFVHISVQVTAFHSFGCISWSRITGYVIVQCFEKPPNCFLQRLHSYFLTSQVWRLQFLHILISTF